MNMLFRTLLLRRNLCASLPVVRFVRVRAYSILKRKKVWESVDEAVSAVNSGDVLLSGGKLVQYQLQNCEVLKATQVSASAEHQVGNPQRPCTQN